MSNIFNNNKKEIKKKARIREKRRMVQLQTHVYRDLSFNRDATAIQWRKNDCLKTMLDALEIHMERK